MKEATLFRSEQYLKKARQCGRIAETARIPGVKRLYEELARQWRYLAEQADAGQQVGEGSHIYMPTAWRIVGDWPPFRPDSRHTRRAWGYPQASVYVGRL